MSRSTFMSGLGSAAEAVDNEAGCRSGWRVETSAVVEFSLSAEDVDFPSGRIGGLAEPGVVILAGAVEVEVLTVLCSAVELFVGGVAVLVEVIGVRVLFPGPKATEVLRVVVGVVEVLVERKARVVLEELGGNVVVLLGD